MSFLVSSLNFTQGIVCAMIALIIAQASLVSACTVAGGKITNTHVKASLKPRWMYEVQTPYFPNNYPSSTECSWTITAPENYHLLVALKHFEVEPSKECENDYLHVSFTNHSIPYWRKYCSILSDNYINSLRLQRKLHVVYSKRMMLQFVSDGSSEFKGFQGEVRLIAPALVLPNQQEDISCRNHLNDTSGSFTTPKHPHPYAINMSCTWHLTVPSGKYVHLRFTSFDLENTVNKDGDCANDYVEIREGVWGRIGGVILGRYCNNGTIPPDVTSPSNQMWIRFISSDQKTKNKHKGFSAHFKDSPWASGSRFMPSHIWICFCAFFMLITTFH